MNIEKEYVEGLLRKIERLQAERDCHHAWQNKACIIFTRILESEEAVIDSDVKSIIDSELMLDIGDFLNETPQQCLRDVQAEAGKAGFIAGANWAFFTVSNTNGVVVDEDKIMAADRHAAKVRQGGE